MDKLSRAQFNNDYEARKLAAAVACGQITADIIRMKNQVEVLNKQRLNEDAAFHEPATVITSILTPTLGLPILIFWALAPFWWIVIIGVWVFPPPLAQLIGWPLGIATWIYGVRGFKKWAAVLKSRREKWVSHKLNRSIECAQCRNLDPKNATSSGFCCTVCGHTTAA